MTNRGAIGERWTLITPANQYPSRLAELEQPVVKLVTPRFVPARFGFYLITGAGTIAPGFETFTYALDSGEFAYYPPDQGFELTGSGRTILVKRPYSGDAPPAAFSGHRDDEPFAATPVPGFTRRELIPPDDPAHDFNMSLLRFEPGVGLDKIEIHDEEHGLYMTAGGGLYTLDREEHPVQQDDFIYMAPYVPQGFVAGDEGGEYLLYKDVFRDGFA